MQHAAAAGKVEDLRRLAHSLRGSAVYLGAGGLAARCLALEHDVDQVQPNPEPHVRAIEEEFGRVREFLRDRFAA
jgi:HPt (histidine-containing phosphotransfer) domain-containing protein